MNIKLDKQGRILNPAVQIVTSVYAMQKNGTSVSSANLSPVFMKQDDEPLHVFRDVDPLYNADLDPFEISKLRDQERQSEDTSRHAQNINAVINN